jgi:regulator of replication initiation timing
MIELLPALSNALGLVNKLKDVGDKLKHAELKELIGDLKLQLADLKIGMADLIEENDSLRRQVAQLQNANGESCPKCHHKSWNIEKSEPDSIYDFMGATRRTYLCSNCDFTESVLIGGPK